MDYAAAISKVKPALPYVALAILLYLAWKKWQEIENNKMIRNLENTTPGIKGNLEGFVIYLKPVAESTPLDYIFGWWISYPELQGIIDYLVSATDSELAYLSNRCKAVYGRTLYNILDDAYGVSLSSWNYTEVVTRLKTLQSIQ